MPTTWNFHSASRIVFGRDATQQLGQVAAEMAARRVLIVTDQTLVGAGLVEHVSAQLNQAGIEIATYDGGRPDAPTDAVDECAARAEHFQPDVLLGLGGGSNMDLAKGVVTVMAHGGKCRRYFGDQVVPGPVFPLILVPTTGGTGSEVTGAAVLTESRRQIKFAILSNHLRPRVAIIDPLLAVSCPPQFTADSGIDALTHAIEAYTAINNRQFHVPDGEATIYQGRNPMSDLFAERAISLVGEHLRRAVSDGQDVDAREGMALAALLAGLAFSNSGVAIVHAMEYALSGAVGTPHGRGCGLLLPYAMRFNAAARTESMARIAKLLGEDVRGLSPVEAAELAATAVDRLNRDIGIPVRMRDVGVQASQLDAMAERASKVTNILRVNPRRAVLADLRSILESAM